MESWLIEEYRYTIRNKFGISITGDKTDTMCLRIDKYARECGLSYTDLLTNLKHGNLEYLEGFATAITVNVTSFFRERGHFDFIIENWNQILSNNPRIKQTGEIRVWSAGCSTGEEPYSIAMVLAHEWPEYRPRILATDINAKVVSIAQDGIYSEKIKEDIDPRYMGLFFERYEQKYAVAPRIRDMVVFRTFNLMNPFPFKNTFDIIFCRNVMIYFSQEIQNGLIEKFSAVLNTGGLLFIGHSESISSRSSSFKYVQPTVYMKI
jgi:chemotaxis protein methyltransferase CheR